MFWRTGIAANAACGAALLCAQPAWAQAQEWPSKPVRILVGFGAGGGTDAVARIVADRLSEILGQQLVAENKPGIRRSPTIGWTP